MDIAHQETDKIIAKTEKLITKEYKKAHKEVSKKMDDYLARFATKDEKWQQWVASGKKTQAEYKEWKKGQILVGKRWEAMKNTLAADYANAAQIAESIVNGYKSEVYALNHNYATFEVEKESMIDTSYTLYSKEAVERMYRDNPRLYHQPGNKIKQAIKSGKQAAWDKRRIQSVMTQGILQGESIPNLTQRLEKVTGGDHKAAIRNARTMMTGVENAGRLDAIKRANEMGIPTKKQWVATLDARTRHWHRQLDGVIEEPEEPFVNQYGKIMFPGDPEANGANLYNCRCRIRSAIQGFERDMSNLDRRYNENLGNMDYDTWKATKKSISHPITKQEDIGKSMQQAWWNVYAGHGGAKAPAFHKHTAKEGQQIIDWYDQEVLDQMQQELDNLANTEYSDIWQNKTVTPADYQDMDTQIYVKHQYLDKKIAEAQANGNAKALAKYQSQKDSLLDFEEKGKEYNKLDLKLHPEKEAQQEAKKAAGKAAKATNVPETQKVAPKTTVPEPVKEPKLPSEATVNKNIKKLEKELDDLKKDSYEFIWKDPVTPADYIDKKDSIIKKKEYFEKKLKKTNADGDGWDIDKFSGLLEDLEDFEKKGKKYEKALNELDEAKKLKESIEESKILKNAEKVKEEAKKLKDEMDIMKKTKHDLSDIYYDWDNITVEDYDKYSMMMKNQKKKLKESVDIYKNSSNDLGKKKYKLYKENYDKFLDYEKEAKEYKKLKKKADAAEAKLKKAEAIKEKAEAKKKVSLLKKKDYDVNGIKALKDFKSIEDYDKYADDIEKLIKKYSKSKTSKNLTKLKALKEDGEEYKKLKALAEGKKPGSSFGFSPDAYSDARKKAAKSFSSKTVADKWHREWLDKHWDELDEYQKYAVWKYTENSNPLNKPLSGYIDSWKRSHFKGVGNVDWGYEDSWRHLNTKNFIKKFSKEGTYDNIDHYKVIQELTKAIDKTPIKEDSWYVRGSDKNGLAGIFEGDLFSFDDAKHILEHGSDADVKKAFKGQVFQNHAFTSTGIAGGTGFGGEVKYSIYAPKGTKAIYAEPQSYYGNTVGRKEEIYKKGKRYSDVGDEAEVIFQRGTKYRVHDIRKDSWGDIEIELEVVEQPDYFKTGAEETFNNGATIHKK